MVPTVTCSRPWTWAACPYGVSCSSLPWRWRAEPSLLSTRHGRDLWPEAPGMTPELTIVIPALDEGRNLEVLLPALGAVLEEMDLAGEVVVVDRGSRDDTGAIATAFGARVTAQREPGYGGALRAGFAAATAPWEMTLDADLSHRPTFIRDLWAARG